MSPRKAATSNAEHAKPCRRCGGTGKTLDPKNPSKTSPCPACKGTGRVGGTPLSRKTPTPPSLPRFLDKDTLRSMKTIRNNLSYATQDLSQLTRYDISNVEQRNLAHKKLAALTRLHGQWVSRIESGKHAPGLTKLSAQTRKAAEEILETLPTEGNTGRLNRLRERLSELTTASPPEPTETQKTRNGNGTKK